MQIKLEIWDTGGQERFRTITRSYYDRAMGVILVYDCTDTKSFDDIRNWMKQIENHARPEIAKLLVASKCDIPDKKINTEEAQELAKELGVEFCETSAKESKGVNEAFNCLVKEILKKNKTEVKSPGNGFKVGKIDSQHKNKNNCC